jgi:hypothetical protein
MKRLMLILALALVGFISRASGHEEAPEISFSWLLFYTSGNAREKEIYPWDGNARLSTNDRLAFYVEPENRTSYVYLYYFDTLDGFSLVFPRALKEESFHERGLEQMTISDRTNPRDVYVIASSIRLVEFELLVGRLSDGAGADEKAQTLYDLAEISRRFVNENFRPSTQRDAVVPFGGIYKFKSDLNKVRVRQHTLYAAKIELVA